MKFLKKIKFKSRLSVENFKKFLFLYGSFLQCDILHSLNQAPDNPKNIDIIILLRDALQTIYAPKVENKKETIEKMFKKLEKTIRHYIEKNQHNTIDLQLVRINSNSNVLEEINKKYFKQFFQEFIVSCVSFRRIIRLNNKEIEKFYNDQEGNKVLVQSLLEFNNAISHIIIATYATEDKYHNINKAINHLYRGTIDNYKMVLRFCDKDFNNRQNKYISLFRQVREQEFLHLGQDINSKNIRYNNKDISIIQAYKELYEVFFLEELTKKKTKLP